MSTTSRSLGAHVSASGGIDKTIQRAAEIGCNCVQLFSGSPRIWKKPALESQPVEQLFSEQEKYGVSPVFTHALYLVNLASDKPEILQKSIDSIKYELEFDALVKGAGVVVHLGSHQGRGWDTVKADVAKTLKEILDDTPVNSTLLIENSAGQNGKLCSDLSEIRWLLDQVDSPRLGWCLDTCHAHAAGYALRPKSEVLFQELPVATGKNAPKNHKRGVIEEVITELNLWKSLKCVHVNDSRDAFASGRDRHDNLGDGIIPTEDFIYFLNLVQLATIPLVIEVPGIEGNGPDAENVSRLKKMIGINP